MAIPPLYPLRFEPIFLPRIWGGRTLGELLGQPLPGSGPIGEAWVVSDQDGQMSRVAEGPLRGRTLRELMEEAGPRLLGHGNERRFPLLLKFLDARDTLSVQVHPHDRHTHLLPPGQRGKTEAWLVLQADPGSRIYAGLTPGTDAKQLRQALAGRRIVEHLASFAPRVGDCIFLPAGTVHALGGGVVLFEVQQNSDMTFRLYDWDRVDAQTGMSRPLHVEESLACTDFASTVRGPVTPVVECDGPVRRERLVRCPYFQMWRTESAVPYWIGGTGHCSIVVGLEGEAALHHGEKSYAVRRGDVLLLPAEVGACTCKPAGRLVAAECSTTVEAGEDAHASSKRR
jgi:mannose-6-phosphate isomerase